MGSQALEVGADLIPSLFTEYCALSKQLLRTGREGTVGFQASLSPSWEIMCNGHADAVPGRVDYSLCCDGRSQAAIWTPYGVSVLLLLTMLGCGIPTPV